MHSNQISNEVKLSHSLVLVLLTFHGLAIISVIYLSVFSVYETPVKLLLSLLIVYSFYYYFKKIQNIVEITFKSDGTWDLVRHDGVRFCDRCLLGSYISDWILMLEFYGENESGRVYVYLVPDSVDEEIFSSLKCALKVGA